jgi:pyruvate dehydrogenase E2 component (dihydrolipoamide acetyltransferase)
LVASWREIPHVHIGGRIFGDSLIVMRGRSSRWTITDLLAYALARALVDVPELNGTYSGSSLLSQTVNLSLAVATPRGVVAPTLRNAAALRLVDLSSERRRLVAAAREGRLEKRDLGSGTATFSNLGAFPVDFFAPVITGPQIALIATGRVVPEPVVINEMIALKHRLWANVAIDHRAADGEAGGRLLAALENHIAQLPSAIEAEGVG